METDRRDTWPRRLARTLLPAALVAISLLSGPRASALDVASASGFDAHEHSQYCDCGVKCKKRACCCGPETAKVRPASKTSYVDPGPCLNSAPCGDPIAPNPSAPSPAVKASAIVAHQAAFVADAGRLLPPGSRGLLPLRRSSRLDDPPERPDVA